MSNIVNTLLPSNYSLAASVFDPDGYISQQASLAFRILPDNSIQLNVSRNSNSPLDDTTIVFSLTLSHWIVFGGSLQLVSPPGTKLRCSALKLSGLSQQTLCDDTATAMIVLTNCFEDQPSPILLTFTNFANPVCETLPFSITTYQATNPIETLQNSHPTSSFIFYKPQLSSKPHQPSPAPSQSLPPS
jgi:hypothetical protein